MRKTRLWAAALCALLCAGLLTTAALAVAEPTEAFYVADYADVLSEDTEQYIVEQNATPPAARSWWWRWTSWTA